MPNNPKHQVVCFGEILWDILPGGAQPGGAPMNVAYHLQNLGNNPALITKVGLDDHGQKLVDLLSKRSVCTDFFQVDYEHPTGLVYATPNQHNEVIYDIVYPSAWDYIWWDESLSNLMEEADYFIFGSLATRGIESRNTLFELLEMAKTKVLDINLRPPYFNKKLVKELLGKADILKLNIAELHMITGWFADFKDDTDRLKLLKDKFQLDTLLLTRGANGAVLNIDDTFYEHNGYAVDVADTVGSGDAFLAGFLSSLIEKSSPQEMLDFASAIGALIASYPGACPQYEKNEIINIKKRKTENID
jgi:fructokinase